MRILFIDAFDSFSNSIISLLETELPVTVESIKIDDPRFVLNDEAFFRYLDGFEAVVAGPGPGHPANPKDVGLIGKLWTLPPDHLLPVLGICLGFQSLCLAYGARIERLKEPRHGIMALITHNNSDIFSDTGKVVATQYHSLHVKILGEQNAKPGALDSWQPPAECGQMMPLAWDVLNVSNGPILMGVRHVQQPFWGVQYHPESICTNKQGQKLISNWWQRVSEWHLQRQEMSVKRPSSRQPIRRPVLHDDCRAKVAEGVSPVHRRVDWRSVQLPDSADISQLLNSIRRISVKEPFVLESGTRNGKPVNPETGRFSIIGLPDDSMQIRYFTTHGRLEVYHHDTMVYSRQQSNANDALAFIEQTVKKNKAQHGPANVPFWGGLVGYIAYEAGLETIQVGPSQRGADEPNRPDVWFILVHRSIVIDHIDGVAYLQSMRGNDEAWLDMAQCTITELQESDAAPPVLDMQGGIPGTVNSTPRQPKYCNQVRECQSLLRAGESYELCLTDQTKIHSTVDPWQLYTHLRARNPAPFSSFLHLQNNDSPSLAVVSSSPERFLSWTRSGKCQFRPIKGTVKKGPTVTRAKAEEILGSAKERAENLMIVDLIRHDLSGVKGVSNVRVPSLMSIEEYETVYQLVSVIEGDLDASTTGISALAASLPPGSMTGAPKKRSCELLQSIEGGEPRGLYSGVIGYFDFGGGGDFSVVIRTAFKWEDEEWRVGAGGAVTAMSEPTSEWEEMLIKRASVLDSFVDDRRQV